MICHDFERWLDEGSPAEHEAAMRAHAASCASCARALVAVEALEAELAKPMASAPADFTDRVLARIERPTPMPLLAPATPWWLRALTEPTAVLTLLLIGVVTTGWKVLWSVVGILAMRGAESVHLTWAAATAAMSRTSWGALLERPDVALGLQLGGLCLALLAVPVLYRMSMRVASRAAGVR